MKCPILNYFVGKRAQRREEGNQQGTDRRSPESRKAGAEAYRKEKSLKGYSTEMLIMFFRWPSLYS